MVGPERNSFWLDVDYGDFQADSGSIRRGIAGRSNAADGQLNLRIYLRVEEILRVAAIFERRSAMA
jgi:hypothetical protein